MIHLYGISFRNFDFVRKSLDSIIDNASEPLCITVAHNPDNLPNSGNEAIQDYLGDLVCEGEVKRALIFKDNNIGWSLVQAMKDFPPDDSEDFFIMTDLDVVVPDGHDYLREIRQAKAAGAVLSGYSLDLSNHDDPDDGFVDSGFGNWLMAPNTRLYQKYFGYEQNTLDTQIINTFVQHGLVLQLRTRLYHMAWNLSKQRDEGGDPEYAIFKRLAGPQWILKPRPSDMSYKLIERKDEHQ